MDDKTAKIIETLSQKLGTTTEYLWGVLIKQAHISATIGLVQVIAVFLFGWVVWKVHKNLLKERERGEGYKETGYEKYGDASYIGMGIAAISFFILVIAIFCNAEYIINGYFNPEYWALNNILDKIN